MLACHIYETEHEIVVSKLDCIIARVHKKYFPYTQDAIELIADVLKGVGQVVEVE